MALEKMIAVIMVKVVLLGGVDDPSSLVLGGLPGATQWRAVVSYNEFGQRTVDYVGAPELLSYVLRRVREGEGPLTFEGRPSLNLKGQQISHDTNAGVTVVIGPDDETVKLLFEPAPEENLRKAILDASESADWPDWQFEFPWPETGPAYYLEQVEEDLYRRVELADKGGYSVSVQPKGSPEELSVDVEFARSTLSGGRYDETIRAYVGKPVLIKNVVTSSVPITPGKQTLLIWHADRQPAEPIQPGATAHVPAPGESTGPPPAWAVGEWELTAGDEEQNGLMAIDAEGNMSISGGINADIRGMPWLQASGQIHSGVRDGRMLLSGKLNPDGTGFLRANAGGQTVTWTATRTQPPREVALPEDAAPRAIPGRQWEEALMARPTPPRPSRVAVLLELKESPAEQ